ncbi:hypothetical protein BaRGS_00032322 [Batillaria attramentaria]|uniref:Uncharacterized protein n=1 Tax=Batillaria attramentaria TaxID=370345 RepID=A0ABD0JN96_9CAEN
MAHSKFLRVCRKLAGVIMRHSSQLLSLRPVLRGLSVLKSAGVDPSSVFGSASSFEEDSDISIMRDVAARTYAFMNRMPYRSCLSRFQTLQRMWTIFQVRGYLSVNITFPLTRQQAEVTTLTQFQKLLKAAYRDSGDRKVTKLQRHSALVDTFCRLPRPLLKQLQVYLKDDCELFGYECDVDFRFNASVPARSPYFFS